MRASAFLTVAETAARLRISQTMIRKLGRSGKLPTHRIGDRILISEEDLQTFLAAHRFGKVEAAPSPSGYLPEAVG